MKINKIFITTLIVFIYLYISIWSFNYINAWVGIGVFILGIFISTKLIFKNLKKN